MNKYKTITQKSYQQTYTNSNKKKINIPQIKIPNLIQQPLISTNKSIVAIKITSNKRQDINRLPSSLYQSSLRRLKKAYSTQAKQSKNSDIKFNELNEQLEEKILKNNLQTLIKSTLPSVTPTAIRKSHQQYSARLTDQIKQVHSRKDDTKSIQKDFISKNRMKQTFSNEKQHFLIEKKSARQIDKAIFNSSFSQGFQKQSNRFKMSQQINQHMNRYNIKNTFQANLNGFRSIIYPINQTTYIKSNLQSLDTFFEDQSTLSKRKQSRFTIFNKFNQQSTKFSNPNKYLTRPYPLTKPPEIYKIKQQRNAKFMDCTPWQTDLINFD